MARILAVDDSAAMRQMVGITLTGAGHDVQQASDGAEALELAERQRFDLVITDVLMPDGDGIELICEVKKVQPTARIIAISGGGHYLRASDCLGMAKGLGAHAVLMKPFDRAQLMETIERVLPAGVGGRS